VIHSVDALIRSGVTLHFAEGGMVKVLWPRARTRKDRDGGPTALFPFTEH
jgi:hypothetical protein